MGPAGEELGVLTVYVVRETLGAMEIGGDGWKEVLLTDNPYYIIPYMLVNVNATTVCVYQQDLLGHAHEVKAFSQSDVLKGRISGGAAQTVSNTSKRFYRG